MSKASEFLNTIDDTRIAAAIGAAENRTSCEFRVLVSRGRAPDPVAAAAEQFVDLGMEATKLRNAVLIYVAPASRTFALYADTAAHRHVGQPLVQRLAAEMGEHFRRGDFTGGLEHVLRVLSESLAEAFPPDASLGNELSDTIVRD